MSLNYINSSETLDESRRGARIRSAGLVPVEIQPAAKSMAPTLDAEGWMEREGDGGGERESVSLAEKPAGL